MITTINRPVARLLDWLDVNPGGLIVVGDLKTPTSEWHEFADTNPGVTFLDVQTQINFAPELSAAIGWGTYARKNIGYRFAEFLGGEVFETDDDTFPRHELASLLDLVDSGGKIALDLRSTEKWWNPYELFASGLNLWPRGFPLEEIAKAGQFSLSDYEVETKGCVQFLVNNEPDFDAIYRLTRDQLEFNFPTSSQLVSLQQCYSPGNTQATYAKSPSETLYFPKTCSLRVADILRSYWIQVLDGITYGGFLVEQIRNPHNYLQDFKDEIPLYTHANAMLDTVIAGASGGMELIISNLIAEGYLESGELEIFNVFRSGFLRS